MTSSITVAQLLELVRLRHALFAQARMPDGMLVAALNARQRTLLLLYGDAVDGLYSRSVELATVISGVLVGSSSGTPVYLTTYEDGWPAHQTAGGVPYVDFSEPAVAGDPFGEHGGTPGFPLPTDFVKLIRAAVVYDNAQIGPVEIVREVARLERTRLSTPTAFISGNRIVPIRPLTTGNSGDAWSASITALQLSYVAVPIVTALTDVLTLPAIMSEPLIAGLAETLATNTPELSAAEKSAFAADARRAEEMLAAYGTDVTADASVSRVLYRG